MPIDLLFPTGIVEGGSFSSIQSLLYPLFPIKRVSTDVLRTELLLLLTSFPDWDSCDFPLVRGGLCIATIPHLD